MRKGLVAAFDCMKLIISSLFCQLWLQAPRRASHDTVYHQSARRRREEVGSLC
jgi:hypothetical protein